MTTVCIVVARSALLCVSSPKSQAESNEPSGFLLARLLLASSLVDWARSGDSAALTARGTNHMGINGATEQSQRHTNRSKTKEASPRTLATRLSLNCDSWVSIRLRMARATNVCQETSLDGWNSCTKAAGSDYSNPLEMGQISASPKRAREQPECGIRFPSAATSCQDQFATRSQISKKLGSAACDRVVDGRAIEIESKERKRT